MVAGMGRPRMKAADSGPLSSAWHSRAAAFEEGVVEETRPPAARTRQAAGESPRCDRIAEIPELERLARRYRVHPIEVPLGREAAAGRDQQQRRRSDPGYELLERA